MAQTLSGERAAGIYSLIGTAKLNGLDPEGYLRYVLERIADHPINRVGPVAPLGGRRSAADRSTAAGSLNPRAK